MDYKIYSVIDKKNRELLLLGYTRDMKDARWRHTNAAGEPNPSKAVYKQMKETGLEHIEIKVLCLAEDKEDAKEKKRLLTAAYGLDNADKVSIDTLTSNK